MNKNTFYECIKYKIENITDKPLFYYHIPKSGGTTFCDVFRIVFQKSLRILGTLFPNNDKGGITAFERFNNDKSKYLKTINDSEFVTGHLPFAMQPYIRDRFSTITVLRKPEERAISHYLWCINRGFVNKDEDIEKLYINNKLPPNPICNQFANNYNNYKNNNTDINLVIDNIKQINYLCRLEDILDLAKLIISKYDKHNLIFQNRQINLKKESLSQDQIKIFKKYNSIDNEIYNTIISKKMFLKFNQINNEKNDSDYIYCSRNVLLANKNMCYVKNSLIDQVKNNLISAGYRIHTH